MFWLLLSLYLPHQLGSAEDLLIDSLRPVLFENGSPKLIGRLTEAQGRKIYEASFSYRAETYARDREEDRLAIGFGELADTPFFLKAGSLAYLLWPKREFSNKSGCRCALQNLTKKNKWIRMALVGGVGVWLSNDVRLAFLHSQKDFELEWFENYEKQRAQAEEWGYDGSERERRLALELQRIQRANLRTLLEAALAPDYELGEIESDFRLADLGSGFVDRAHFAIYSKSQNSILLLRFQFSNESKVWSVAHSAWVERSQWESDLENQSEAKINSRFVGQLDYQSFWNLSAE